jgi:hypothetical protein
MKMVRLARIGTSLKITSQQKSRPWCRNRLRTAISTSHYNGIGDVTRVASTCPGIMLTNDDTSVELMDCVRKVMTANFIFMI